MRLHVWLPVVVLLFSAGAGAQDRVSIAVMEFASKGGITQKQMDALSELVANEIDGLGQFTVIGKADIRSMLDLEQRKQQLDGCSDQACLSEIGGALGVRWVVAGSVSLFGETYLLNLRLIDVVKAQVGSRASKQIRGGEDMLISEVPGLLRDLFERAEDKLGVELAEVSLSTFEPIRTQWVEIEAHLCAYGGMWKGGVETLEAQGYSVAAGSMNGARMGGGVRAGLLLGEMHLPYVQLDYLREHWNGTATQSISLDPDLILGIDFDVIRLLAGYRFAYPVLDWLAPFAEMALGAHLYLSKDVPLEGAAGSVEVVPDSKSRFALMFGMGIRFHFFDHLVITLSYLWDIPVLGVSTSSFVAGAGATF